MNNDFSRGLVEATRLTRAGRLAEATTFIQRALQGKAAASGASAVRPPPGPPIIDLVPDKIEVTDPQSSSDECRPVATDRPEGQAHAHASPRIPQALQGFLTRSDLGVTASPPHPSATANDRDGGQFVAKSYGNDAGVRDYKLYIPSYRPAELAPLIVMLHGCTQSPDDFAAGTRMNALAEAHGCFVAYPAQAAIANASKCWNWFNPGDQRRDRGEPSLVAGITREIMNEHPIDPQQVYVAGLSAGGAAAVVMATTYPDLYAAVGVHSGLACGSASDLPSALAAMRRGSSGRFSGDASHAQRLMPTIVFHGDRDATVHPRNGDQVMAQFLKAPETLQARLETGRSLGGLAYSRTLQIDGHGRPIMEQWVVHGGGHAWYGGSAAGSYTDPRGPDASTEMLRFFLEHRHPAPRAP